MKRSETIEKYQDKIARNMVACYRSVLESDGVIQFKLYIWEDGDIAIHESFQGDNSWLQPRDTELRNLYEVCTITFPCFDAWVYTDHSAPDNEAKRESEHRDIVDWMVEEYEENVFDTLDTIISLARQDEAYAAASENMKED